MEGVLLSPEQRMEALCGRMDALLTRLEGTLAALGGGTLSPGPSGASVLLQYPRDPEQEAKDEALIEKYIQEWRQGQVEAPPLAD